jgi:hypothetical protein
MEATKHRNRERNNPQKSKKTSWWKAYAIRLHVGAREQSGK